MRIPIKPWTILPIAALTIFVSGSDALAVDEPGQSAGGGYAVVKTLPVGGEGRWDCITVDPATKMIYIGRSTYTQAIDAQTGRVTGELKDTPGVHGVAVAADSPAMVVMLRSRSLT